MSKFTADLSINYFFYNFLLNHKQFHFSVNPVQSVENPKYTLEQKRTTSQTVVNCWTNAEINSKSNTPCLHYSTKIHKNPQSLREPVLSTNPKKTKCSLPTVYKSLAPASCEYPIQRLSNTLLSHSLYDFSSILT